ncbi:MAG: hypothetical protein IPK83_00230 [Planctomycetes bacterium]|nr:hypothetical protein [Planctomycetota bacterium]
MNPIHLLACNPFAGVPWDSLFFIFFVVKPITYFAFTYAFRYRVGHRIPLTTGRILGIAIVRTILGVAVVGIEGTYLGLEGNLFASYSYMYISRFFVWYFIGILMLSLRKERLALWVSDGLALNFLFDLTVANFCSKIGES